MTDSVEPIGTPARRAAIQLLDAVLRRGEPLEAALANAGRALAPADRGLSHAIASETLRRLADLDALIDSATAQPLPGDAKARMVLRIALTQALSLGTPPHAAIATALPLVGGGPKRLVHGVFGTLMRRQAALPTIPALPSAVVGRWGAHWGYGALANAAAAITRPPSLDVTLRDAAQDGGLGGISLAPGHRRVPRTGAVAELPGFAEGVWWVQNLSASIPARLLGAGEGRMVLDLCAAPGGKTMQLAAAGWHVIAVEQNARRAERLRENLARTKLEADIVIADVMTWEPPEPVDAILLDAPCTATGIFARHPDVLHRIGARDIAALSALQARMLARTADWLTPAGRLIYATCSVEPEEGEHIVAGGPLVVDPIAQDDLPPGIALQREGWLRILPEPALDGFFIARLKRG